MLLVILEKFNTKVLINSSWLSLSDLVLMMKQNSSSLLIIDVRPKTQFSEYHISFQNLINLPNDLVLKPG